MLFLISHYGYMKIEKRTAIHEGDVKLRISGNIGGKFEKCGEYFSNRIGNMCVEMHIHLQM